MSVRVVFWALVAGLLAGLALAPAGPVCAAPGPGDNLRVELLTIGPGPATWSRFGHSALRFEDVRGRGDVVFDFGTFDDHQGNVIGRFLQGRLQYYLSVSTFRDTVADYRGQGRRIEAQELRLTGRQRLRLFRRLRRLVRPENRQYRYHHFTNNCATRIRDELDRVLGGPLRRQLRRVPAGTYRDWIRRATRGAPWFHLGFDLILTHADRSITLWEAAFAPEALHDGVARVTLAAATGGGRVPLVRATRTVCRGAGFSSAGSDSRAWFLVGLWLLSLLGLAPLLAPGWPRLTRGIAGGALVLWGLAQTLGCVAILFLQFYSTLAQFRGNPNLAVFAPVGPLYIWSGLRLATGWRGGARPPRWLFAVLLAYLLTILVLHMLPGLSCPWPELWITTFVLQVGFFLVLAWARQTSSAEASDRFTERRSA